MKYYTEEIFVMNDGTSPISITERATELEARSAFHMTMATAYVNENVASVHAEAKNSVGGVYETATWVRQVEPEPQPESEE